MSASEYPWQQVYQSALLELDKGILPAKISEAEYAIFLRYQELAASYSPDERIAMHDAVQALLVLKEDRLGYPGNVLTDEKGREGKLKPRAKIEVTVKAEIDATTPKNPPNHPS